MERECRKPDLCTLSSLNSRTVSAGFVGKEREGDLRNGEFCKQLLPNVKRTSGESANSFEIQPAGNKECEPAGGGRGSLKAKGRAAAQGWIAKDRESEDEEFLLHVAQENVPAELVRLLTLQETTVVTFPDGIAEGCQRSVTTTDERPERAVAVGTDGKGSVSQG